MNLLLSFYWKKYVLPPVKQDSDRNADWQLQDSAITFPNTISYVKLQWWKNLRSGQF